MQPCCRQSSHDFCGDRQFKCGDKLNFLNIIFLAIIKIDLKELHYPNSKALKWSFYFNCGQEELHVLEGGNNSSSTGNWNFCKCLSLSLLSLSLTLTHTRSSFFSISLSLSVTLKLIRFLYTLDKWPARDVLEVMNEGNYYKRSKFEKI